MKGHYVFYRALSDVPKADMTVIGFYNLLSAIEEELSNPDSTAYIYKDDHPAQSVARDCIK